MTALDLTVAFAYLVVNAVSCALMGVDKRRARRGLYRISEATLLLWCGCFGALGGLLGMRVFRHKTRRLKFTITVPFLMVAQIVLLAIYYR